MQYTENSSSKRNVLRKIAITSAWLTLPILGIILLLITSFSSTTPEYMLDGGSNTGTSNLALNGLLGIILILILIILTARYRKSSYFYHLRIGLFIGLGLYGIVFILGVAVDKFASNATNNQACTTPLQQFENRGDAIVPIATELGSGTGFSVNEDGTVLTAYHVIEDSKKIYANYSSGEVKMKVIETAPQYDLALLKLSKPTESYFDLSESYTAGDTVYAYGYPGNTLTAGPPSLSTGIVSRVIDLASLRMTAQDAPNGLELIQTDTAINAGNSGGPLVGSCGVIGVVSFASDTSGLHQYTGSVSEQNIGFAISSKTAIAAFPETFRAE